VNLRPTAYKVPLDMPLPPGTADSAVASISTGSSTGGGRHRGPPKEETAPSADHELQAEMVVAPQVPPPQALYRGPCPGPSNPCRSHCLYPGRSLALSYPP